MLSSIRNLLQRHLTSGFPSLPLPRIAGRFTLPAIRVFSASSGAGDGGAKDDQWGNAWGGAAGAGGGGGEGLDWGESPSWSAGLTREHFDGEAVGRRVEDSMNKLREQVRSLEVENDILRALEKDNRKSKAFVDGWNERMLDTYRLLKQVYEPGARGAYLKDSEKAEMYRLHKENPEVNTVEKLAKDYRIMRQRVHAILWLKELEAEEEKKRGAPLDDSIEILLDNFPEYVEDIVLNVFGFKFFNSHDLEFHVASLPYKPDFKVMPEGWDGTTRDPDEVLYEISMKEDQMLYEEFVQRFEFNKKKMAGEVKCHKYSRRRPPEGWKFTVEKLGPRDKRGSGGGLKFVSLPDGSSRELNEMEKMFVKRETPKKRRRILPPFK